MDKTLAKRRKTTNLIHSERRTLLTTLIAQVVNGIMYDIIQTESQVKGPVQARNRFNFDEHCGQLTESEFHRMYRMTYERFINLRDLIAPHCERSHRKESEKNRTVSVEIMLMITLRMLGGASYLDVSWPYGVSKSTVYSVFHETIDILHNKLRNIHFPRTEQQCRSESEKFRKMRRSPLNGIVAALDGIAVAIVKPRSDHIEDPRKYYNRKGFFAIVVQAAVSADYKFLFVSAKHAGSTHDATAIAGTKLYDVLSKSLLPPWAHVVGDDAYSNTGHLLTPYSGTVTPEQDSFNFYHSSCRIVVEQTFGILVNRWGILWSPIKFSVQTATEIIMVCCKLHNYIAEKGPETVPECPPNHVDNDVIGEPTIHFQNLLHTETNIVRDRRSSRHNSSIRDEIALSLQNLGFVRRSSRQNPSAFP